MAGFESRAVHGDRGAPVGRVAARTLRRRFDRVWAELQAACDRPDRVEHVHQLRVATRRAIAAVDAFADCIPARRREWIEKRLRRLRRAAGEARDLDVLAERLAGDDASRARRQLVTMLAKRRQRSRRPIRAQLEKFLEQDWRFRVDRLLEDVGRRRRHTAFQAYARRRVEAMADDFFETADRRLRDNDDVHALRIAGKKMRYGLEVFANALPQRPQARCRESLERMQETLGDFNDHASAADRLSRWAKGSEAGPNRHLLLALGREEDRRADLARKAFCKWWNPERRRVLRRCFDRTLRQKPA